MLGVLIIAAIAAAVVLGYKTKINTGFGSVPDSV